MKINRDSWHFKAYEFSEFLMASIINEKYRGTQHFVNLCPYVRSILIWLPLRALVYLCPLVALFYSFVYLPFFYVGVGSGGLTLYGILIGALLLSAVGILVGWIIYLSITKITEYNKNKPSPKKSEDPGFIKLATKQWSSTHDKICPTLEFEND